MPEEEGVASIAYAGEGSFAAPVERLQAVIGQVGCCVRHGEPPSRRIRFALQSKPTLETRRRFSMPLLSGAARIGEHFEKVKIAHFVDWPLCARCARTRWWGLALAKVMFFGGLLTMVGACVAGAVLDGPNTGLALPSTGGFALMLASPVPFVLGSVPCVIQAKTSDDGVSVVFDCPHPNFVAGVRALLADVRTAQVAPTAEAGRRERQREPGGRAPAGEAGS